MGKNIINIALFGLGRIGQMHAINLIDHKDFNLKYIFDNNQDGIWNTGDWEQKIQAEKVINYPSEITIRSNWDLELEWIIGE